jgi:hypothetical protein
MIPQKVERPYHRHDEQPGRQGDPGSDLQELPTLLGHHAPPGWRRRRLVTMDAKTITDVSMFGMTWTTTICRSFAPTARAPSRFAIWKSGRGVIHFFGFAGRPL